MITDNLDVGYWMVWMLDAGYSILDTGCWILDTGYWMICDIHLMPDRRFHL